jgi:hypothetical protein
MSVIVLISLAICSIVALAILYVFGINNTTLRAGACIVFFGTIIVALMLGAFD